MRMRLSFLVITSLLLSFISFSPAANSLTSNLEIQAITDAKAGSVDLTFNSKFSKASVLTYQITAKPNTLGAATYSKTFTRKVSGYISQRITPLTPGTNYKFKVTIKTTNKKVFNSADFSFYTASTKPNVPVITKAIETDADEAVVYFDAPNNDGQTPVLYYTANAYPGYATGITLQQGSGSITLTGLTKSTSYTFTVTAHNINGTSVASMPSAPIKTLAEKIIRIAPTSSGGSTLAAPAFTISSNAETKTVNNAITGYTIDASGGGTIASYSISPAAPAGLTFSTSTGLLTGTPNSARSATAYTITATNASGNATQTFTLTVSPVVYTIGQTGPGGGKIFYYNATPFVCGPTGAGSCNYLEVAPTAGSGKFYSSNKTVVVSGATATQIGSGYQNTRAIITANPTDTSTFAAVFADEYSNTVSGVVYDDWYLPSKDELNQLYVNKSSISGISIANETLSSSQSPTNALLALAQSLTNGIQFETNKYNPSNSFWAYPIRAG